MTPADARSLSADKRALLEQRLRGARSSPPPSALARRRREGPAPLSPAQEQLWYFARFAPDNPVYNEAVSIRKDGPFDSGAFRAAFEGILARHEIWRTTFRELGGEPFQIIAPASTLELPIIDLSNMPAAEREREAVRRAAAVARVPYDLEHGPLLRPLLMRFSEDHHRLYLGIHHLIFDAVSLYRVILPELVTLYDALAAGHEPSLPEPAVQYSDYSVAVRDQGDGPAHAQRIGYWRRHLSGAPMLQLPLDHPRPPTQRFHGAAQPVWISRELSDRLRSLAQASGVTLFQVLVAAFTVLLHRYSGQEDIVFGTAADMREGGELAHMVGYCVTSLALRVDVQADPSFLELLSRVRDELLDALSNPVPFERLVRELRPQRELGANPLFQVAIVLEPSREVVDPAWSLHLMDVGLGNAIGTAKFDLHLELDERREGHIAGRLIYDGDLFEPETAARIAGHWMAVLEGVVAAPSRPVSELPLLSAEQCHQQLVEWNSTSAGYPRDACVHELVSAQAGRTPDAVAAVFGDAELSYRELDERASSVAQQLAAGNPHRGPVAIYLERSLDMLVGLLAILKSGAAYLPLDLGHPAARLTLMLEDSGATALLTHSALLPALRDHPVNVVLMDGDPGGVAAAPAPLPPVTAEDPAYVLYTSGSTGRPKGVCISHRSVVNLLTSVARQFGITADDTIMAITTYAFDIAATELWLPLVTGARVVIAPRDVTADGRRLASLVERSRVTVMQATPATWQMMLEAGWRGQSGLVAVSTGEPLPPQLAESLLDLTAVLWNMYGPTETTVWSTGERVERGASITIGRPLENTRTYVLSPARQPVPVGVAGELAIAGDGVGLGYMNRPELTDERFVPDPFVEGGRMYLTGDLTRYLGDGRIEHLGRLDDQIKIRGFRVEPGEIEAALTAAPDVAAAAVVARGNALAEKRLVAYVVPAGVPPRASELRARLRDTLPAYMVPSSFVNLDALPLSANGKLDRNALPDPQASESENGAHHAAPRDAAETRMADVWARTLGVEHLGIHDDFFELGGHSLLALRMLVTVQREFDVELPLSSFFDSATLTVASLTAKIAMARERGTRNGDGADPPQTEPPIVFFAQPWASAVAALRHFAKTLGPGYRLVALVPECVGGLFDRSQSVGELARPMLATLRENQPHGPYYIAGYSFGGLLAYEIAGHLRAEGEEVAWLGLLDSATPDWMRHTFSLRQKVWRQLRRGPREALAVFDEDFRRELALGLRRRLPIRNEIPDKFDRLGATWLTVRHDCAPHDAALDLFLAESELVASEQESLGWSEVHPGPVHVHRIDGDHLAMMREGNVEALAEMVSARVKEAHRARGG